MRTLQIRLTEKQLNFIKQEVKKGYHPNSSEAIRNIVSQYFKIKCGD